MVKVVQLATSQTITLTRSDAGVPRFSVMMSQAMMTNITTYLGKKDSIREQCLVRSGKENEPSNSSGSNSKVQVQSIEVETQKNNSRRKSSMNSMSTLTSRGRPKKQVLQEMTRKVQTIKVKWKLDLKMQ